MTLNERRRGIMSMAIANGIMMQKTTTIHPEDWTSDSKGNASHFISTYFTKGDGLYFATITNNSATQYKAISAVSAKGEINASQTGLGQVRRSSGVAATSTSTSFYITAGAQITVWFCPKEELEK